MGPLVAAIVGALAWIVPFIVRYIFIGLGVGAITFIGVSAAIDQLETYVAQAFSGLPANLAAMLSLARLDEALSLVVSAYAARVSILYSLKSSISWYLGKGAAGP
jgi:Na+-transporting NADH:ubiquinone oxidoreductase subunit NqrE